jgi:hypothetical protein
MDIVLSADEPKSPRPLQLYRTCFLIRMCSQGRHDQPWDASGFSSGAYYVRLDVDGKSAVRQVVLIK